MKKLFPFIALCTIMLMQCAKNDKIADDCKGEVIEDCICTMEYNPVCGCDGITYGNPCAAGCAGVSSYTSGPCK